MEIKTLTAKTVEVHKATEELLNITEQAVADKRFKMSLADHRAFRDLVDDMELILNRAWRESIKIPADLEYRTQNKKTINVEK